MRLHRFAEVIEEPANSSDFGAFRQCQCVVDVDAKLPDRILDVRVTQQDLDDAKAVVSYHGTLTTHEAARKDKVKPVVAAYSGLDDPYAPADTIETLRNELSAAEAQFHIVEFAKVGHSFTNPDANGEMPGIAYNAVADVVSWAGTLALFETTLRR
jgi:dienelactone hydrolase